ncbi:MAG: LamG domain-containing protein [Planctomycetota bacterium]
MAPPSLPIVTIEAWVRPDALTGPSSYGGILVGDGAWNLALTHGVPGRASTSVCVPGCNAASTPADALSVGTWHHLAMTYDGVSIDLYLDGMLVDSTPHAGSANNVSLVHIGRWPASGSFAGEIDEVRIWSVVRTATEIADTRHQILTGNEPGLFAYWRFEEGSGQVSADGTPNGNPVTLGADVNVAADDATWADGGAPVS